MAFGNRFPQLFASGAVPKCSVYLLRMTMKSLTTGGRNWTDVPPFAVYMVRRSFNETFWCRHRSRQNTFTALYSCSLWRLASLWKSVVLFLSNRSADDQSFAPGIWTGLKMIACDTNSDRRRVMLFGVVDDMLRGRRISLETWKQKADEIKETKLIADKHVMVFDGMVLLCITRRYMSQLWMGCCCHRFYLGYI